jgi:hypothetical protein
VLQPRATSERARPARGRPMKRMLSIYHRAGLTAHAGVSLASLTCE